VRPLDAVDALSLLPSSIGGEETSEKGLAAPSGQTSTTLASAMAPMRLKLAILGSLAPYASALVPLAQPCAPTSIGAETRKMGAPVGLRQPRNNKPGLASRLASALLPSLFEAPLEDEEMPDEPEATAAVRRSNSHDELMSRICE